MLAHVHDLVDEIVVVDGMSDDNSVEVAASYGARVFARRPWGYVEPDRMFALRMASNDWILYLDVDERLGARLKSELRDIVERLRAEGYAAAKVNSILVVKGRPILRKLALYQIRVYNKRRVLYKGVVHELPQVKGEVASLDPWDYYIFHLKGDSWLKLWSRSVKYAYLERVQVYRTRNYVERALLSLNLALMGAPILVAEKIIRNPPLTVHSIPHPVFQGLYRALVLSLIQLRGRKRGRIAKYVQEHGLIGLLNLY